MANLSASILRVDDDDCLLCGKTICENEAINTFSQKGWSSVVKNAQKWKEIRMPVDSEFYLFSTVIKRVQGKEVAFGRAHERCRITFASKSATYKSRHGCVVSVVSDEKENGPDNDERPKKKVINVHTRKSEPVHDNICFICNSAHTSDNNAFIDGGLGKPKSSASMARLNSRTRVYLQNSEDPFHQAACRFVGRNGGFSVIVSNILYHQPCYVR